MAILTSVTGTMLIKWKESFYVDYLGIFINVLSFLIVSRLELRIKENFYLLESAHF